MFVNVLPSHFCTGVPFNVATKKQDSFFINSSKEVVQLVVCVSLFVCKMTLKLWTDMLAKFSGNYDNGTRNN